MENLEQFVGRKVKGVNFQSSKYGMVMFASDMEKFVGVEGVITEYDETFETFRIDFQQDSWFYPVESILPQLEEDIIGYVINDKKYIKIIASLCGRSEKDMAELISNYNTHFSANSVVERIVKDFDLLDKCTPVYKEVNKLPVINGFEGKDEDDYIRYGCTQLPKLWFSSSYNRSIKSMTLDSGVVINEEQMSEIREYLDSSKKYM